MTVGENLAIVVVEEQLTGSPANSALNEARTNKRQLIAGRKSLKIKRAKLNGEPVNSSACIRRNDSDGNSDANSQEDSTDAPLKLSNVWSIFDAEDSTSDAND